MVYTIGATVDDMEVHPEHKIEPGFKPLPADDFISRVGTDKRSRLKTEIRDTVRAVTLVTVAGVAVTVGVLAEDLVKVINCEPTYGTDMRGGDFFSDLML